MKRLVAIAIFALVLVPGSAGGHAQKTTSDPEAGSKVGAPVDHIVINMTETPVEDATSVEVTDGCKRILVTDMFTESKTVHINVNEPGQPGKWKVDYETLSAEDGHTSGDSFTFRVGGKKDCSTPQPSPDPEVSPAETSDPVGGQEDDDGGSFPMVPVAAAAIAIAGVALLARGGSKG